MCMELKVAEWNNVRLLETYVEMSQSCMQTDKEFDEFDQMQIEILKRMDAYFKRMECYEIDAAQFR